MEERTNSIKGLKETAKRILEATANKERIILFGDADPDGVASVIILEETIEEIGDQGKGPEIIVYFPDRKKEGYGINISALDFLKDKAPALLISLDCGIGNIEEVKIANSLGFEVIIIDHHEVLSRLPAASIVVDPTQKDDKYPFKHLACAGIVYKLAKLLFSQTEKKWEPERFLALVMLSTLGDQMPLREENRRLVKEGILALEYTKRPGLKALMKISDFENLGIEEILHKLLYPLSSAEAQDHLNEAYLLLTETSEKEAMKMATLLQERGRQKRNQIKRTFEEVLSRRPGNKEPLIFEGDKDWSVTLIGPVASRIYRQFKKPTFIFQKGDKESQGAVRMERDLNAVKVMTKCHQFLETYGGHAPAAGFRVKNENLEKFKKCLIDYFKKL